MYAFVMASSIYPVIVAWTWGYGWLRNPFDAQIINLRAAASCTSLTVLPGLAGTVVLGTRKSQFEHPEQVDAHSLPLVVLGTFILRLGWYGFICGSNLEMSEGADLPGGHEHEDPAATGGIAHDVGGLCNGILAGRVSITVP